MGEELADVFENKDQNEVKIAIEVDVDNQGTRPVRVPCGIIQGDDDKLIIFGAHHDTVYSGPGAVDDTSGTATVLELARQFGIMFSELGTPKHTIKFCTWGGEEEGLHGSKAWVEKYADSLNEELILYMNFDMNHVDADPVRGNDLTLFGNYQSDVDQIESIVTLFESAHPDLASKYEINIRTLDGPKNSETGMPYNSDHGPFVYDIQQDDDDDAGHALVCYGSGSWEYHTYADDMSRFNEESLAVSAIIYGTYARYLAWGEV
jgi:Zn-dependent M28 family amino/carboxypeptidase